MEGAQVSFLYLAILLVSITGLVTIDYRFKLAISKSKNSFVLILISIAFFLIWDLAGISSGIFFRGSASHLTGILLSNELPIEEIFFLFVLSYSALLLIEAFSRLGKRK